MIRAWSVLGDGASLDEVIKNLVVILGPPPTFDARPCRHWQLKGGGAEKVKRMFVQGQVEEGGVGGRPIYTPVVDTSPRHFVERGRPMAARAPCPIGNGTTPPAEACSVRVPSHVLGTGYPYPLLHQQSPSYSGALQRSSLVPQHNNTQPATLEGSESACVCWLSQAPPHRQTAR